MTMPSDWESVAFDIEEHDLGEVYDFYQYKVGVAVSPDGQEFFLLGVTDDEDLEEGQEPEWVELAFPDPDAFARNVTYAVQQYRARKANES